MSTGKMPATLWFIRLERTLGVKSSRDCLKGGWGEWRGKIMAFQENGVQGDLEGRKEAEGTEDSDRDLMGAPPAYR